MSAKHFDWVCEIVAAHGKCKDRAEAAALLRAEVAKVCSQVLADAGVYKQDENGLSGFKRFMASLGYQS
jgi:UDPglucose--hexose-1-phosphate uridylyltransferase